MTILDRGGGGRHYTPSAPHQRPLPSPPSTLPENTIPSSNLSPDPPSLPDTMVQRLKNQVDQLRVALAQSQEAVKIKKKTKKYRRQTSTRYSASPFKTAIHTHTHITGEASAEPIQDRNQSAHADATPRRPARYLSCIYVTTGNLTAVLGISTHANFTQLWHTTH